MNPPARKIRVVKSAPKSPAVAPVEVSTTHTDSFGITYLDGDTVVLNVEVSVRLSTRYQSSEVKAGISFKALPVNADDYVSKAFTKIRASLDPQIQDTMHLLVEYANNMQGAAN